MPEPIAPPTDDLRAQLEDARKTIAQLERRQKIDALLADADTIDVEAARLLTEVAVARMSSPDVAAAVEDLRRHRPYLFRHRSNSAAVMPAKTTEAPPATEDAAVRAGTTGHRRDLLRYLRLRRGT